MELLERSSKLELWEILVPTEYRLEVQKDGTPKYYRKRFHQVWDKKVRDITGGLTILAPSKGQWVSPQGDLFVERMIPVRIACTRDQIDTIIDMTIKYYDQLAVMAIKISEEVIIRNKKESKCGTTK